MGWNVFLYTSLPVADAKKAVLLHNKQMEKLGAHPEVQGWLKQNQLEHWTEAVGDAWVMRANPDDMKANDLPDCPTMIDIQKPFPESESPLQVTSLRLLIEKVKARLVVGDFVNGSTGDEYLEELSQFPGFEHLAEPAALTAQEIEDCEFVASANLPDELSENDSRITELANAAKDMVKSRVKHPETVSVNPVAGLSTLNLELQVHDVDFEPLVESGALDQIRQDIVRQGARVKVRVILELIENLESLFDETSTP